MSEAQVLQAIVVVKVEEDGQSPDLIVECIATDYPELRQWQPADLVCGNEDIACHLPDSL